ncbi:hypothetical protein AB836_00035 [Rickettsiales bacterium (ex Bugula neritina AB1)]|nr:hypothetical protein AB836_00035 [Rickettsiales bacterium (ex Bugula neritina AB1)]
MKTLIIGLGNPNLYKTVHNIGGDILIYYLLSFENVKKIQNNLYEKDGIFYYYNPSIMNISGKNIYEFIKYRNFKNIFVIFDDIRTKLGKYKIEKNDKNYGHNGIKSIQQYIGDNFYRVRIGVGPKPINIDLNTFVLSTIENSDYKNILNMKESILKNIYEI